MKYKADFPSMKWDSWSAELPSKLDYSSKTEVERDLHVQFGMWAVRDEFALFKRTGNGFHMWRCYQLWRRLMPDELALPRELLAYLDDCADAVADTTDPHELKRAMKISKPPGDMADHGGGRSGKTAARPVRRQREIVEHVRSELRKAQIRGATPRGYKTAIYQATAERFSISRGHVERLAGEWSVAATVERDVERWRKRRKVARTPRD